MSSNEVKEIILCCRKRDERGYGVQKYDNKAVWNVEGGLAPNGVCATRWLRRTNPDVSQLSSLAKWLVENVHKRPYGHMTSSRRKDDVICYNGKTEAQGMREEVEVKISFFNPPSEVVEKERKSVENMIRCYDLENTYMNCNWLFSIIEPNQTDEQYWNVEAQRMLDIGTVAVETNGRRWEK